MIKFLFILIFLLLNVNLNYGASGQRHDFNQEDCITCHIDEKNDPANIKRAVTDSCSGCHMNVNMAFNHPTERYPYASTVVPDDMPLMDGKLTCLTCHYVHPRKGIVNDTFARRSIADSFYCITCHNNDKREHTAAGKAHFNLNTSLMNMSIDMMSKLCIECHNRKISESKTYFGLGRCDSKVNHPVGISYTINNSRKTGEFRPETALHNNVNLYNGKMGCGTCHNIYSQFRYLLVIDNDKSRLCLECHIK